MEDTTLQDFILAQAPDRRASFAAMRPDQLAERFRLGQAAIAQADAAKNQAFQNRARVIAADRQARAARSQMMLGQRAGTALQNINAMQPQQQPLGPLAGAMQESGQLSPMDARITAAAMLAPPAPGRPGIVSTPAVRAKRIDDLKRFALTTPTTIPAGLPNAPPPSAPADPYADTPADAARKAILSSMVFRGSRGPGRRAEITPGTPQPGMDPNIDLRATAGAILQPRYSDPRTIAARTAQSQQARANAAKFDANRAAYLAANPGASDAQIAAFGGGRPTVQGNALRRQTAVFNQRVALAKLNAELQATASGNETPQMQAAKIKLLNEQANAVRMGVTPSERLANINSRNAVAINNLHQARIVPQKDAAGKLIPLTPEELAHNAIIDKKIAMLAQ